MRLREERGWRRRTWPIVFAAIVACAMCAPSAGATESRHYEKVSPADKGQGDVVGDGLTNVAADAGDGVVFNSRTPFGDTVGSGGLGQTQYVGRRGPAGWTAHAVTPMGRPDAVQTLFAGTLVQAYSSDLATAVVWGYDLPGGAGTPRRNNIYVEDTATRGLRPVTLSQVDPLTFADFLNQQVWGISKDAKHLAIVTSRQLLRDAAPGAPNVYQWDDGVLSVAGVLPDGRVPSTGSDAWPGTYRGGMSADGTRLAFNAASPTGGSTQLYLRIGGNRTAWVSQPEGSDQNDPAGVLLQAMTPDGRNVFFVTDSALLDEDVIPGPDLYRYTDSANPAADRNLTLITHDGSVPGDFFGAAVVGASNDGQVVYYHTITDQLVVWDHGTTKVIRAGISRESEPTRQLTVLAPGPGYGRVTPDGEQFAFVTAALTGTAQVYLYSLRTDRFQCISCPSGPPKGEATVVPGVTSAPVLSVNTAIRPRFLSDRGQVFFSSPESLVPEDRNGVVDAYEYDSSSGELRLLSTGKGRDPATFVDASASGDDVFVVTRQHLTSSDRDNLVDIYDARVGPPLPEPPTTNVPPCDGEGCQPTASTPPLDDSLGSLSFDGESGGGAAARTFTVRSQLTVHGRAGTLPVRLLVPGRLKWGGRGLRAGSVKRGRAQTYRLQLRLTRHARVKLKQTGSYATTIRLTFVSADGDQVRDATRVTFRASTKKGR